MGCPNPEVLSMVTQYRATVPGVLQDSPTSKTNKASRQQCSRGTPRFCGFYAKVALVPDTPIDGPNLKLVTGCAN